jgi:mono/diheme cytochrome c family protein
MTRLIPLIAALLSWSLAARAAEPALALSGNGVERLLPLSRLLGDPRDRDVTVADPVYGRAMTYRVLPVAEVLKDLRPGGDDHIQAKAVDGFSVSIPARLLLAIDPGAPRAFLALERPDAPWPVIPVENQTTSAGPFYLVWLQAGRERVSSEYWAYRLAGLTLVDSPARRWPALAVGAEVVEGDPIRRGQRRFVEVCFACHRFDGAGEAEMGPDLARPMNPVAYFQPAALRKYLRDPGALRTWPERKMPAFAESDLSDADIDAVIAWLAYKARRP